MPQDLCLLEDRSAQLNVVLPLEIDGIPRVDLDGARRRACSRGSASRPRRRCRSTACRQSARQRVAVARALVREPELVIADHPTSMQDAEGAELVCGALGDAAERRRRVPGARSRSALRAIAERDGWRQLVLVDGTLRPLAEIALDGRTIDELLVD